MPTGYYGVDLREIRTTIDAARSDPAVVGGWQIPLDGRLRVV